MNQFTKLSCVLALLTGSLTLNTLAAPNGGEVDFGKFVATGEDARFIEVNVKRGLICLAAKLVEEQEPEAAKLLRSVQLVRVNVIGLNDENREATKKRMAEVRAHLDKEGWERIVTAQEASGENVGVYVKTRGEEALEGLVVTVLDGNAKEAVFINVVGDIRPEQVATVGKALGIDPLKKAGESLKK